MIGIKKVLFLIIRRILYILIEYYRRLLEELGQFPSFRGGGGAVPDPVGGGGIILFLYIFLTYI